MLINAIKLHNFLSFGDTAETVQLRPLNVIIGPNGSGKSNLLEAIELLRNAPDQLLKPIREGGGISEWLWKGAQDTPVASIEVLFDEIAGHPEVSPLFLHYGLSFSISAQRFLLMDEKINRGDEIYYHFNNGRPLLKTLDGEKTLEQDAIDRDKSVLAQIRDTYQYTMITHTAKNLSKIKLYREWSFGRRSNVRVPEKADLPNDMLETDNSNLGLVLHRLSTEPKIKRCILDALHALSDGIDDFGVTIEGGTVQVFFRDWTCKEVCVNGQNMVG
jgi:predicted ATPase